MMSEALVARIRYHIKKANFMGLKDAESTLLLGEAANAIEELARRNEQFMYTPLPAWVSVKERLPDSGVHVLVSCKSNGGCRYVCDAFYSAPKTEVCSYNDDIDMEYDEETDEYYMPEGWWEVIKNWDEYSCVGIEDTVTHWMPLPQPMKG